MTEPFPTRDQYPTADQFCRGRFKGAEGRHCSVGWVHQFPEAFRSVERFSAFRQGYLAEAGRKDLRHADLGDIVLINDAHANSLEDIAACWAAGMDRCREAAAE